MNRRSFLGASAAGLSTASAADVHKQPNQYFELRFFQLRNSKADQSKRLTGFLEEHHLPMTKRNGIGPVGYFQVYLGSDMPKIVTVSAFRSWNEVAEKRAARGADRKWTQAADAMGASAEPVFERVETWLLRAFDGMPRLEEPAIEPGKALRFFDLRTYESETFRDSAMKIDMFNQEEIKIFRRSSINPVFFGESVFGSRQPNLTYMVWYDDMRAREAAWEKFLADPDWKRISTKPGWTNAEAVSNISNRFLQPLPFSPIR
ncbi:MAG: NIPSNAP family protein [Acidobacteria bacterium]|nr:NIPSNAP family protein [Acidobacteriota bacterium]